VSIVLSNLFQIFVLNGIGGTLPSGICCCEGKGKEEREEEVGAREWHGVKAKKGELVL